MSNHDIKWATLDWVGKRRFDADPEGTSLKRVPLDIGIPPVRIAVGNKTSDVLDWNWDSGNGWNT